MSVPAAELVLRWLYPHKVEPLAQFIRLPSSYRTMPLPSGGLRILFYGEDTGLAPALQAALQTAMPDRAFTVINAARHNMGPDIALLAMEDDIPELRPAVVILQVNAANAMGSIVKNGYVTRDNTRVLRKHVDAGSVIPQHTSFDYKGWFHSLLLVRATQRFLPVTRMERLPPAYEYDSDIAATPQAPSALEKIGLLDATLKYILVLNRLHHAQVLLLITPAAEDILGKSRFDNPAYPGYHPRNLTSAIAQVSISNEIPYINFDPVFLRNNPAQLYDGNTTNGQASLLMATTTTTYMMRNQMLPTP